MKFERTDVWGIENALRGARNPLESWEKSDTDFSECITPVYRYEEHGEVVELTACEDVCPYINYSCCPPLIGPNDTNLAQKLIRAGSEHRKFLRQIFVSVDITAPLYWWSEADTYKIGVTANSTSTMHTIMKKPFSSDLFECEGMRGYKRTVTQEANIIDEDTEEWKKHPEYENYLISNQGRVKRLSYVNTNNNRRMKEKILAGSLHSDGYIYISILLGNSKYRQISKHRLVAQTFLDNPNNFPEINHKDGNKLNNSVENLEWVTSSDNQIHAVQNNLQPKNIYTYKGKLTKEQRDEIIFRYSTTDISKRKLAKEYNVSHTTICSIINNKYNYGEGYKNEFETFLNQLNELNELREEWLITKDKEVWKTLIEKLPRNWLQMRTVTMNYENLYTMIRQRRNHKLNEWSGKDNPELTNFIGWAKTLPYAEEFLFLGLED